MSSDLTKIGKYRIERELGRGTSSRVYLGHDPFADRQVAIKVMQKDVGTGESADQQINKIFLNEASLAGRLSHPHIIEILDADVANESGYIVMEYVDGRTLEQYCKVDTLMPLNRVVELAFKCGLALDFASRQGVIHCDIKPANILVGNNGDIKLTDFGIALRSDAEDTQLQGVGSPTYMSPEQIREEELTFQTDIYSLGIVMYQMLTGKVPFVASNNTALAYQVAHTDPVPPTVHRTDLPADIERIVMKAIAKDVNERYQSWSQFAQDLSLVNKELSTSGDAFNETEQFSAIKKVRFFRDFGELEVWEMVRIAAFRRLDPGETILHEGEVCDSFYLIVSGEARVEIGGNGVSVLGGGDCFGEIPYFEDRGPRTSSVVAITPMVFIEVNANALRLSSDACQKQFNRGFLGILLDRIDRLTKANMQLVKSINKTQDPKIQTTPGVAKDATKHKSQTNARAPKEEELKIVSPKPVRKEAAKKAESGKKNQLETAEKTVKVAKPVTAKQAAPAKKSAKAVQAGNAKKSEHVKTSPGVRRSANVQGPGVSAKPSTGIQAGEDATPQVAGENVGNSVSANDKQQKKRNNWVRMDQSAIPDNPAKTDEPVVPKETVSPEQQTKSRSDKWTKVDEPVKLQKEPDVTSAAEAKPTAETEKPKAAEKSGELELQLVDIAD